MPQTDNYNINLPTPGASQGVWGSVLNTALNEIDSKIFQTKVPTGGASGQVLGKVSDSDYDINWITVQSGGSGGGASIAIQPVTNSGITVSGSPINGSGTITLGINATYLRNTLGIESGATADQTGAEIKTLLFAESDTNNFDDVAKGKLNGIENGAQQTNASRVESAGALMDSDFTANGFLKRNGVGSYTVDANTYLTQVQPSDIQSGGGLTHNEFSGTNNGFLKRTGTEAYSVATTIADNEMPNTAVTAGTYGSTSTYPVITVDVKGRITSASNQALTGSFATQDDIVALSIALG
tara:strand:- start:281 stop:1171 length:891 start_codon:yes stop_codon:yes gene_type:complete